MLTHNLGVPGSDFECNLVSSDWKVMTIETLNSMENGLHKDFQKEGLNVTKHIMTTRLCNKF